MTRREIIFQILSEASARPIEQIGEIFEALMADGIFSGRGLDVDFPEDEASRILDEFRKELENIRGVLIAKGLIA